MQVAPPPMWQSLLLENPWPIVIALVAVAAILRVAGSRQRKPAMSYAALASLVAAVGVYLLAAFVITGREAIIQRTEALVAATAPLDAAALDDLIARGAFVSGPDGRPWVEYDAIRPELEHVLQRFRPSEQTIRSLGAEAQATRGRSVIDLRTSLPNSGYGLPVATVWGLEWRKEGDGQWRVAEIRWLEFMNREPSNRMWR